MMDNMRATYREEALDLLTQLETALLELESSPDDGDLIGRVFRYMHTIKGSGAMFGFDRIAAFTHEIESVFDLVRSGKQAVTQHLITLTLEARDYIRTLLEAEFGGPSPDQAEGERLREGFCAIAGQTEGHPVHDAHPVEAEEVPVTAQAATYRVRFRPDAEIFLKGTNPVALLGALRDLGPCTVVARTETIPELDSFDVERCYVFWDVIVSAPGGQNAIQDVFLFVEDDAQVTIRPIEECDETPPVQQRLGEILSERGDALATAVEDTARKQKRIGQLLVEDAKAAPDAVRSALAEQEHIKTVREEKKADGVTSIRVTAAKLDSLVNTVGELVTAQARLSQLAARSGDPELEFVSEEIQRLADQLRGDTMSIRMLPIGASFSRFRRLVRDLCRDLGKEINLVTEGAETELDKNVIEQLNDPLVHLIRNAVDHGVEAPGTRVEAGKPAAGTIRLAARHSGAHVLITIADDGAGLNRDAILRKAVERGIIAPGTELSDAAAFDLIFEPGFSTADRLTEISGRGVGLDVVRRSLTALRGTMEVSSQMGQGTTFTLKLPLTLAIIDGLLVSVGEDYYILPVANVLECVELTRAELARMRGRRRAVAVRDELIPYVPLREYFRLPGEAPEICQVMLAETTQGKFGFMVDRVIGDHQTVVKSLGKVYRNVEAVSGATILGDGAVALILDLDKLAREVARCA